MPAGPTASAGWRRTTSTAIRYELRFRAPGAGANTAALGRPIPPSRTVCSRSPTSWCRRAAISRASTCRSTRTASSTTRSSGRRSPVRPSTLLDATGGAALPATCFDDPAQQGQVTRSDGYYKFDLNFSDPACPSGGNYLIAVAAPGSEYVAGYSQIIPPTSGRLDPAVLRARLPGRAPTTQCRPPLSTAKCSRRSSHRRRRCRPAATGTELPRAPVAGRQPGPGLEPDLQQPHSARPGARRGRRRSPRRRRRST